MDSTYAYKQYHSFLTLQLAWLKQEAGSAIPDTEIATTVLLVSDVL